MLHPEISCSKVSRIYFLRLQITASESLLFTGIDLLVLRQSETDYALKNRSLRSKLHYNKAKLIIPHLSYYVKTSQYFIFKSNFNSSFVKVLQ